MYATNKLTNREIQILECLKTGLPNESIAKMTMLSVSSIKFYISSIISKLYARNRTNAIYIAVRDGFIS